MTPHSSTLAWKIPWTAEPGGLPSVGSHRVDTTEAAAAAAAALTGSVMAFVHEGGFHLQG